MDFGEFWVGEKPTIDLLIRNTWSHDMVFKKLTASCGCSGGVYDSLVIKPSERGRVSVFLEAGSSTLIS
ncbi:DUF1573 domain-containing protein [Rhodopirellula sp. P2]|uniref:DUF1573 domain-containing protein n=1 Tax=Rhodopirellula sp. P2 TaxID=2127060 RepID=UPI003FD43B25